jgi:spermidine synthase
MLVVLAVAPGWATYWDADLLAIYRNNQREVFDSDEKIREAVENTDVLFFREGINETISVIRPKGAHRAVVVNGKVVSSTMPQDLQCVRALGHVPMLLHPDPKKAFVLGMGTGVTLGSVSVHPELEELHLAEIEPLVLEAAKSFADVNHDVANDPRLRIAINGGRNFLLTTEERYDVITADPIHPWSRGSAYLYTREYFELAASRLRPGGIMCQWLPIYELTPEDLATVVGTFSKNFRHVLLWLTFWDAELIGSNDPIVIDPEDLERRLSHPKVAADLAEVGMGTVEDFLSYFVAGTEPLRRFGARGTVNTDDNLHLEFSAPKSVGIPGLMAENVWILSGFRESPGAHTRRHPDPSVQEEWSGMWRRLREAGRLFAPAHAQWLRGGALTAEFETAFRPLELAFPEYSPTRLLTRFREMEWRRTPKLVSRISLAVRSANGVVDPLDLAAVKMHVGERRGSVAFVDNARRRLFGRLYVDGDDAQDVDRRMDALAEAVLGDVGRLHRDLESRNGGRPPYRNDFSARLESLIRARGPEP